MWIHWAVSIFLNQLWKNILASSASGFSHLSDLYIQPVVSKSVGRGQKYKIGNLAAFQKQWAKLLAIQTYDKPGVFVCWHELEQGNI